MKVNSQLERAQLENLSSLPAAATVGRIAQNTTDGKTYLDNGASWVAFIKNDGQAIIGTSGTAANNTRFHRGANGLLQVVLGSDATAEGTLSTSLSQISAKQENYVAASLPAFGNSGRLAYVTDTGFLNLDNGSAWKVLVDTTGTQTLTGKTLTAPVMSGPVISDAITFTQISTPANPSAGTNKVYTKADNKMYVLDSSGNETAVGSGGGFNYISVNPSAESGTFGWATYADAAGASPVDGTGGSPNSTFTRSATAPLRGTGSFLFTHNSGASRQGEGASYDFSIDSADKAKILQVSFDYLLDSGTFVAGDTGVDSDLTVWIYDVTNGVVIQPSNYKLAFNSTTVPGKFSAQFQTSYNSTSYRLIVHCGTTSTAAFVMKLDNFNVGPQTLSTGSLITDWQDFPSVAAGTLITGSGSNPTYGTTTTNKAQYRRVGGNLEIRWDYVQTTSGSEGVGIMLFNIPGSIGAIDTTLAPVYTGTTIGSPSSMSLGSWVTQRNSGSLQLPGSVYAYSSSQLAIFYLIGSINQANQWNAASGLFSNGAANISMFASIPIQGWATNTTVLSSGEGRVVAASATQTGNVSVTGGSPIILPSVVEDSHGAYNAATGEFTCPVAGTYKVSAGGIMSTGQRTLKVYRDGVYVMSIVSVNTTAVLSGSFNVKCNAGQKLTVVPDSSDTLIYSAGNYQAFVAFERISGPEQIQAGEIVAVRYESSGAIAGSTTTPWDFSIKGYDTHGAVTTGSSWKFTAPVAGYYQVNVSGLNPGVAFCGVAIYKNGTSYEALFNTPSASETKSGSTSLYLLAGEYIDLRPDQPATINNNGRISIYRIK